MKLRPFRIPYWRRHSTEGFCWLQTYFRIKEEDILGCCGVNWVIYSRRFEGKFRLHLQVNELLNSLLTLSTKAVHVSQTAGNKLPKNWFLDCHSAETSNHCFRIFKNILLYDYFILIYFLLVQN